MLDLVMLGLIPGFVLGIRFRVAVLLLVSLIGGLNILGIGLLSGRSLQTALWATVVACVALQVGYVVGSLIAMLPFVERRLRSVRPAGRGLPASEATSSGFMKSLFGRFSLKK